MATAESAGAALLSHLAKSARRFCALKDVEDFVCKWYPSLEVGVVSVGGSSWVIKVCLSSGTATCAGLIKPARMDSVSDN